MTLKAFRDALRILNRDDAKSRQRATQIFARYTSDEWVEGALDLWPGALRREWVVFWLGAGLWLCLTLGGIYFAHGDSIGIGFTLLISLFLGTIAVVRFALSGLSMLPLLVRLDDIRLVPLWLQNLPEPSPRRTAILERLTEHLPAWHATGLPLPERARGCLLREVQSLVNYGWSDTGAAFLTAALGLLDSDPRRGIPADADTIKALAAFQPREDDDRVRAAVEDAVQRLGNPRG